MSREKIINISLVSVYFLFLIYSYISDFQVGIEIDIIIHII
jgi:hypothetical protein